MSETLRVVDGSKFVIEKQTVQQIEYDMTQLAKEIAQLNADIEYLIAVRTEKQSKIDAGKALGLSEVIIPSETIDTVEVKLEADLNKDGQITPDEKWSIFKPSTWSFFK